MRRHAPWMLPAWTLLALWMAGPPGCQSESTNSSLLHDVLGGIDKGISFYAEDYSANNLDGLFGMRLCQGNLMQTLNDCAQEGFNCPPDLLERIKVMISTTGDIGDKSIPYVKANSELYFSRFHEVVERPYLIKYVPERLDQPSLTPFNEDRFNFDVGDVCFSSLLGTFVGQGRKFPRCTVHDSCLKYMTREDTSNYFATHQLLYFIFADHAGCQDQLEDALVGTELKARDMKRRKCQDIYTQAVNEDRGGRVHTMEQDLFIEQVLLCGALGFEDFLSEKWIKMVLSWQNPQGGCFQNIYPPSNLEDQGIPPDYQAHAAGRKLMAEQLMHGDCLAHKTGLGFGTFALYVRYIVRQTYGPGTTG